MLSCRLGGPARNFCEAAKDTSSQKRFQAFRIESEAGISLALTEENLRRKETVLSVQTIKIITVGGWKESTNAASIRHTVRVA